MLWNVRGTFTHFLTLEDTVPCKGGVPGVGILAERAGYVESVKVPDYSADDLLEAIDADADADADSFDPSFIDLDISPYME